MSHKQAKRNRQETRERVSRLSRTQPELTEEFRHQVEFLRLSAAGYDAGRPQEAKRMSVALRVLLHDAGQSHSLIGQLGLLNTIPHYDSAGPVEPGNLASTMGLIGAHIEWRGEDDPIGFYMAPLDDTPRPGRWVEFGTWWRAPVSRLEPEAIDISRSQYVLMVANKIGAHVDPEFDPIYAAISKENAFRWTVGRKTHDVERNLGPLQGDPVFAAIRQVAHEFERTVTTHLRPLLVSLQPTA